MRGHKITYIAAGTSPIIISKLGESKRITLKYSNGPKTATSCVPYGGSRYGFILMKVKYPPFKFTWDKNLFDKANDNYCLGLSYLLFDEIFLQDSYPEQIPKTVFMHKNSNLVDSINYGGIGIKYADGKTDTLQANYVFQFMNSGLGSPTENLAGIISKIYPNPCRDQLNLFLPEVTKGAITVNIYGINGAIMQVYHKFSNDIISVETASLSSGNYIVEVITNDKRRFIAKFDKIL